MKNKGSIIEVLRGEEKLKATGLAIRVLTDLEGLQKPGAYVEVVPQLLPAFNGAIPAALHVLGRAAGQTPPDLTVIFYERI